MSRLAERVAVTRRIFPLTTFGVVVLLGASLPLLQLAYTEMDLVAIMVGDAFVALPTLSVVVVSLAALLVRRRLRRVADLPAANLDTAREFETEFRLPSFRFLPFLSVSYRVVDPEGVASNTRGKRGVLREAITFRDRGIVNELRREVDVGDVFGLARVTLTHSQPAALTVQPNVGAFREMNSLTSFAGGDDLGSPMGLTQGDRTELRRYTERDPARFIHWKAYARTQRLLVRQPERALSRARRTLAYLVAGPNDDATAGIARAAISSKAFGDDWLFGADAASSDASHVALADRLIVESIAARRDGGVGLLAFLARAEMNGPASCVLFLPPTPGPWLARVTQILRTRHPMRVLIGVDAPARPRRTSLWARIFLQQRFDADVDADGLDQIVRALRAVRAEVTVLNRASGRATVSASPKATATNRVAKKEAA